MPRLGLVALCTLAACPALAQCVGGVCPLPDPRTGPLGAGWHTPRIPVLDAPLADRLAASTVRIVNDEGRGRSIGSGAIVETNGHAALVLTCGHLFREGIGRVVVVTPVGGTYTGRVLGVDSAWDIAVVQIAAGRAASLPLALSRPAHREPLYYAGYGPQGRFASGAGRLVGYVRMQSTPTADTLQLIGAARQGDSGGPIVSARGRLVGLIVGTDGRIVIGPSCGPIARFLARFRLRSQGTRDREQGTEVGSQRSEVSQQGTANDEVRNPNDEKSRTPPPPRDEEPAVPHRAPSGETDEASPDSAFRTPHSAFETLLPLLLAALGISVPPTTVLLALRVVRCIRRVYIRKKRRQRRNHDPKPSSTKHHAQNPASPVRPDEACSPPAAVAHRQLNDEYAAQLASVFAYSGQSPLQDATLGREFSQEIDRAARSSDAKMAEWAQEVRDRVMRRFHRIHGWTPSPAEPTD